MILNIVLALVVLATTLVCGAGLVFGIGSHGRWFTKIVLSFSIGYVLLSLAGILANSLGMSPFPIQTGVVLAGVALCLYYRDQFQGGLDRDDWIVIVIGSLYVFICLLFFDYIIIWMAGDAVCHASIMRMLLDGESIPVSIYPFGSYWEYYPKAFHLYSYYWARLFPLLNVVQVVPVLITAVTPALLYSIVRELGEREVALYSFVIACFLFPQHYMYLIWAGYPAAAAEMLMVAAILVAVVDKRLFPLVVLGIALTHTRFLAYLAGIIFVWLCFVYLKRRYLPYVLVISALLLLMVVKLFDLHGPLFLSSIITSQDLAAEYVSRWYPALLSVFGVVIALYRREKLDRLIVSWALAVMVMVVVADVGVFDFGTTPDRVLSKLYLPFSVFAAFVLSSMEVSMQRLKTAFVLLILVIGAASICVVFYSYAGSWAIPEADYEAMVWLGDQGYVDAVCINPDDTGAWVYPLAEMEVAHQIIGPDMWYGFAPYNYRFFQSMIADPNCKLVIDTIGSSEYTYNLIYISNVSISRPGYVPPFSRFHSRYPVLNLSFSEDYYDLVYDRGAYIYEFKEQ